ncbi:MAG: M20 family metallo-hydrolase [Saprospiraceae bacterium]|nr:M20 family metallo-hydrolase [Saprospiraceae bacterium]
MKAISELSLIAVSLLKNLISIPSFSKEEDRTADIIQEFLAEQNITYHRIKNNVFAYNESFDASKPTTLLNSHHDTVKPNPGYTKDPFTPITEDGKLYGLGSNDAGGCLVSLLATFLYYHDATDLKYNICFAATAEEEISGANGIELFIQESAKIHTLGRHPGDFAIIGEPTQMQMAVAEKGLLVLDCIAKGQAGHAARDEGINALYLALEDINRIKNHTFDKVSSFLGPVKMTVTSILTENKAHNVVPDTCSFVVDLRVNELYSFDEILDILQQNLTSEIIPRSKRLRSSMIPENHPIVIAGKNIGKSLYGSPTTSDKALVVIPALKMGPGDSARSHTADEFIFIHEIEEGINDYITIVGNLIKKSL